MDTNDLPGASNDNAVTRGIHKASGALHQTIDKLADPAMETVDQLQYKAHAGVDSLEGKAASVADKIAGKAGRVTQGPAEALAATRECIRENPLQSLAAAAAIGWFIGWLHGLSTRRY